MNAEKNEGVFHRQSRSLHCGCYGNGTSNYTEKIQKFGDFVEAFFARITILFSEAIQNWYNIVFICYNKVFIKFIE